MKDLYLKIHEVFEKTETKKKYTDFNLKSIRTIDLYAGQDFNPENFEINLFPAIFLSWKIDYQAQLSIGSLSVRVAYEQIRDISNFGKSKNKGLLFLDQVNITDEIIKSIQTPNTGSLSLISEELDLQPTVVDVYVLNYEFSYTGNKKFREKEYINKKVEQLKLSNQLKNRL